jgi:hypothetical protein
MDQNPYQAPATTFDTPAVIDASGRMRNVARYQKGLLIGVLGYPIFAMTGIPSPWSVQLALVAVTIVLGLVSATFAVLIVKQLHHVIIAVILGLLTLVPCLGILALLRVNAMATAALQRNGIRVGLLGADMGQFAD